MSQDPNIAHAPRGSACGWDGAAFYLNNVDSSGRLLVRNTIWDSDVLDWVSESASGASSTPYKFNNFEDAGTVLYIGESVSGGSWRINRIVKATLLSEYAAGASDYSTAWTNRASQSYGY
jgi:hypothetical protein